MCYQGAVPRFEPFAGLRYDDDVAPAGEVIAPPYDVVDDDERAALGQRSPYNAIHVELPEDDPSSPLDRYAHAASLFAEWQHEGVLRRDDVPSLYLYRMRFVDELGQQRSTLGVIGAMEMDVANAGVVLPHERTMPKPKGDRLDLLRATGINTSPIWGLSLTPGLAAACEAASDGEGAVTATDDEGVVHELVPVVDPVAIATIAALVGSSPVVIADGHHRYETAIFNREEQRAENGDRDGPHDLVMTLVVELTPNELVVQPIHRVISGLPRDFPLREALVAWFELRPGPSEPGALIVAMRETGALGLVDRDGSTLLVPRPEVEELAEADLDSCRLDVALATLPTHDLTYQHGAANAVGPVTDGRADAAVLLRAAGVEQIADTAHSGHRMPPKTTFFYPKPRTGLVYREVRASR